MMSPFSYSSNGIDVSKQGAVKPIPKGEYILRILEAAPGETKNGDPKVTVHFEVADGDHKGRRINYHTVTFFRDKNAKGASMALHFLGCIGEPASGDFQVNEKNWVGKKLKAWVKIEPDSEGREWNKVGNVQPLEQDAEEDLQVPF